MRKKEENLGNKQMSMVTQPMRENEAWLLSRVTTFDNQRKLVGKLKMNIQ